MIRNKEYNNFCTMCLQNGLQPCSEIKWKYLVAKTSKNSSISKIPLYDFRKI